MDINLIVRMAQQLIRAMQDWTRLSRGAVSSLYVGVLKCKSSNHLPGILEERVELDLF